ncbi:MAG TPA: hypothetical protein VLN48_08520 [Bryobacteraceae bacterium]|nr:hypothetical protein [Bryobacteraceae bacterium]
MRFWRPVVASARNDPTMEITQLVPAGLSEVLARSIAPRGRITGGDKIQK